MHLLGFWALAASLLAAALLPGRRPAPAAAADAAYESGPGLADAEPDAGEAQVGARGGAVRAAGSGGTRGHPGWGTGGGRGTTGWDAVCLDLPGL